MAVKYYKGEMIYFRPLESEDVPLLTEWFNEPDNWKTLGRMRPISHLREQEYIEGLYGSNTDVVFGIVLASNDELLGACGLHDVDFGSRSGTFGIIIGERGYQGLGLGTAATKLILKYAFDELNLNRVQLDVFANNIAGITAYRRAGFIQEGRMRQAVYRNGQYHDLLRLAVLRGEWDQDQVDAVADATPASMTV